MIKLYWIRYEHESSGQDQNSSIDKKDAERDKKKRNTKIYTWI